MECEQISQIAGAVLFSVFIISAAVVLSTLILCCNNGGIPAIIRAIKGLPGWQDE